MLHVFKRSRNAHITFIFGHFTVYAYWTSDFFLAEKTLEFSFQHKKPFQRWNYWTCYKYQVVYNSQECWYVQNNWDLSIYAFRILQLKALWNFHYAFFGRWFCSYAIFKTCRLVQRVWIVAKCKYFLLFHHNNVMLKTDIMLDYW